MSLRNRTLLNLFVVTSLCVLTAAGQSNDSSRLYQQMSERLAAQGQDLIHIRHDIHRNPELSGAEKRTARLVAKRLKKLGFDVRKGVGGHGVVGILEGGQPGPLVAFRADMDAVRSSDYDPVEFRSQIPGVRHICGHDIHTTIGLGIAEGFAAIKEEMPGSVMLIFQPAEERGTGAKAMLTDGLFDSVVPDAIFALHTAPYEVGEIATMPGGLMAGRAALEVTVSGSGDVSGATKSVRKAIEDVGNVSPQAATQIAPKGFILVQLFPTSGASSSDTRVVRGQVMTAGLKDRMIAKSQITSAIEAVDLSDVRIDVSYDEGYMEGVNNDTLVVDLANTGIATYAPDITVRTARGASPVFSEDFGSFQVFVPGAMYFLGVSNAEAGTIGMPHTPSYVADDAAIDVGARAMLAAMLARMTSE